MTKTPFLLAFALVALAVPAGAEECVPTTSTTNDEMIVVAIPPSELPGTGTGVFYVVNDICQDDVDPCLFSVWFYPETNGIPGLQRSDEMHDNTCDGMIEADGWHGW